MPFADTVLFLYVIHEIIGQKKLNIILCLLFQILIHPTFRYIENKSYVFRCFSKAFTRSVFISFNLTPRGLKGAVYRIHKYVTSIFFGMGYENINVPYIQKILI